MPGNVGGEVDERGVFGWEWEWERVFFLIYFF